MKTYNNNGNLGLLWARGLLYFPPVWPWKASICKASVYAEIMRREREELYVYYYDKPAVKVTKSQRSSSVQSAESIPA